jgi:hypothetical protein
MTNLGPVSKLKLTRAPLTVGMAASAAEFHVLPHAATGGWTVDAMDSVPAWFATLGEAEQAALRQASARDASCFLHDRYHRVRPLFARRAQA